MKRWVGSAIITATTLWITYRIVADEQKSRGKNMDWESLIIGLAFIGFICWAVLW